MNLRLFILCFLICLAGVQFAGCSSSDDFVSTVNGGTGSSTNTVALRFDLLARGETSVPAEVTQVGLQPVNRTGSPLGEERQEKRSELEFSVPLETDSCFLSFFNSEGIKTHTQFLELEFRDGRAEIVNPSVNRRNVAGSISDLQILNAPQEVRVGETFQLQVVDPATGERVNSIADFGFSVPVLEEDQNSSGTFRATAPGTVTISVSLEVPTPELSIGTEAGTAARPLVSFFDKERLEDGPTGQQVVSENEEPLKGLRTFEFPEDDEEEDEELADAPFVEFDEDEDEDEDEDDVDVFCFTEDIMVGENGGQTDVYGMISIVNSLAVVRVGRRIGDGVPDIVEGALILRDSVILDGRKPLAAAADVNGDGLVDIFMAVVGGRTVTVLDGATLDLLHEIEVDQPLHDLEPILEETGDLSLPLATGVLASFEGSQQVLEYDLDGQFTGEILISPSVDPDVAAYFSQGRFFVSMTGSQENGNPISVVAERDGGSGQTAFGNANYTQVAQFTGALTEQTGNSAQGYYGTTLFDQNNLDQPRFLICPRGTESYSFDIIDFDGSNQRSLSPAPGSGYRGCIPRAARWELPSRRLRAEVVINVVSDGGTTGTTGTTTGGTTTGTTGTTSGGTTTGGSGTTGTGGSGTTGTTSGGTTLTGTTGTDTGTTGVSTGTTTGGSGTTSGGSGSTTSTGGTSGGSSGGTGGNPPPIGYVLSPSSQAFVPSGDEVVTPDVGIDDDFYVVVANRIGGTVGDHIVCRQYETAFGSGTPTVSPFQSSGEFQASVPNTVTPAFSPCVAVDPSGLFAVGFALDAGPAIDILSRSFSPNPSNPVGPAAVSVVNAQNGEFFDTPRADSSLQRVGASGLLSFVSLENTQVSTEVTDVATLSFIDTLRPTQQSAAVEAGTTKLDVAVSPSGNRTVTVYSTTGGDVAGRLINTQPLIPSFGPGNEFTLHSQSAGTALEVSVDFITEDLFVAVYDVNTGSDTEIRASLFTITGTGATLVQSGTIASASGAQDLDPDVAASAIDNSFWVSWTRRDGSSSRVFGGLFDEQLRLRLPAEIEFSDGQTTAQDSAVAMSEQGHAVVVWDAIFQATSSRAVFVRLAEKS